LQGDLWNPMAITEAESIIHGWAQELIALGFHLIEQSPNIGRITFNPWLTAFGCTGNSGGEGDSRRK